MAKRIKSGLKHLRQSTKRRAANQGVRSRVQTLVKSAGSGTEEELRVALKSIDKAAARGIIHKNAAARKKGRLMRRARVARAKT